MQFSVAAKLTFTNALTHKNSGEGDTLRDKRGWPALEINERLVPACPWAVAPRPLPLVRNYNDNRNNTIQLNRER